MIWCGTAAAEPILSVIMQRGGQACFFNRRISKCLAAAVLRRCWTILSSPDQFRAMARQSQWLLRAMMITPHRDARCPGGTAACT
jgi:hypothetical protein